MRRQRREATRAMGSVGGVPIRTTTTHLYSLLREGVAYPMEIAYTESIRFDLMNFAFARVSSTGLGHSSSKVKSGSALKNVRCGHAD